MITKLEFKEVQGKCVNEGTVEVEHEFEDISQLIQYLKENWFDLENADDIESIEFDYAMDGDFLLTVKEMTDE